MPSRNTLGWPIHDPNKVKSLMYKLKRAVSLNNYSVYSELLSVQRIEDLHILDGGEIDRLIFRFHKHTFKNNHKNHNDLKRPSDEKTTSDLGLNTAFSNM